MYARALVCSHWRGDNRGKWEKRKVARPVVVRCVSYQRKEKEYEYKTPSNSSCSFIIVLHNIPKRVLLLLRDSILLGCCNSARGRASPRKAVLAFAILTVRAGVPRSDSSAIDIKKNVEEARQMYKRAINWTYVCTYTISFHFTSES